MIILSGVLVVVAIALLVAGIVAGNGESADVLGLDALTVIYISIAVSIVSALCLAIGVFLRRKELFGTGAGAPPKAKKAKKPSRKERKAAAKAAKSGAPAAPAKDAKDDKQAKDGAQPAAGGKTAGAAPGAKETRPSAVAPATPADVPEDALVYVIRGRRRYHLDTCRQLAGREKEKEELTYVEAREEGFTPCTACMPDTALAARAAASAPEAGDKTATKPLGKPSGKGGSAAGDPGAKDRAAAPTQQFAKPASAPAASLTKPDIKVESTPEPKTAPTAEQPSPGVVSAAARPGAAGEQPSGPDIEVRILSGTKRYHRASCALIEDIGDEADDLESLPRSEAKARGCTPCLVCQPDKEHARD